MKYAVIETGGKQYRVSEGDVITVERLTHEEKSDFLCSEVLLYKDGDEVLIGTPFINDMTVKGTVVSHIRGDKIRVAKFKSKVRYRKVIGHRQALSQLQITSIGSSKTTKNTVKEEGKVETKSKAARKTVNA